MRIAVFSDVHGNIHALDAVLADIDQRGAFDAVVFAGDLVYGAANPQACVDAVRGRNIQSVYGNTDEFLWIPVDVPEGLEGERLDRWEAFVSTVDWTRNQLNAESIEWLKQLPFELRLSPTNRRMDDLLVVHANPKNISDVILPNRIMQRDRMGEIKQEDDEVAELLLGVSAKTVAFGHVHVPNVREVDDYTLINIASVSRPQDDDWRCKYGVLTFIEGKWSVEHIYVEYDIKQAHEAIRQSDMPGKDSAIEMLIMPTV